MDSKILSFLSYNSTGLDNEKIQWINDLVETTNTVCWQLQEHFKATKTANQYFKQNFKNFDNYVTTAVRGNSTHAGRPKGGLAQFVNKYYDIKKEKVPCKSWRIQAQILHIDNYRILWMNVYMPTDPQLQQIDETEIYETLYEIENILSDCVYHDVILGGDWNFDQKRNTGYCRIVSEFLDRYDLKSVWTKFAADFSYCHTDLASFSLIDHFFVNENFLDNCLDAAPMHLGDNRSNHSPIMLKIRIPDMQRKESINSVVIAKPNWRKAEQEDIDEYTVVLNEKLSDLSLPQSFHCKDVTCKIPYHSEDRDSHAIDILTKIIEASFECIPVTKSWSKNDKSKQQRLPGWKENVLPFKKDSLFWHSIWLSMGKPNSGGAFDVMRHTRNKYHYAVRRAKKEANRLKSVALGEAAASGNLALFKEMKQHLYRKNSSESVPESLEGKVTHDDILDKFRECYSELFNSADTSVEMLDVKSKIENIIQNNLNVSCMEAEKITPAAIKDAATLMRPHKQDVSGFYTSDVFLNAPDSLFVHLAAIFKSFLVHGTVTREILSCAFMPLYKGGLKDSTKFKSYRAIAGASQLLKLFEYVILKLWGHCLTSDSLQFGFKPGLSTTQCSWLVLEVANWYVQRGGVCQAAFMDCSMAFDKCMFSKLFPKMLAKGIPPIVVRSLIFAYEEQKGWVRLAGRNSDTFTIKNATRQGSVLSPYLFSSCYLDDLITELRKSGLGCHVAGVWMGAVAFADDLTLLATNRTMLQKMITICEQYGAEHNLVFSTDPDPKKSKTKCVLFNGQKKASYPPAVTLDDKELPWVDKADHLGHIVQQDLSMESDASKARGSFMSRASDMRDHLFFAHPEQRIQAIQLYCCDGYGSMLWELKSRYSDSYFKAWNIQARLAWNVPRDTHRNLIEHYFCAGYKSLRRQILSRYHTFLENLARSPSKEVRFLSSLLKKDSRSVTGRNLKFLNDECKTDNILKHPNSEIKDMLRTENDCEGWRTSLLTTLLEARRQETYAALNISKNVAEQMINSLCSS